MKKINRKVELCLFRQSVFVSQYTALDFDILLNLLAEGKKKI